MLHYLSEEVSVRPGRADKEVTPNQDSAYLHSLNANIGTAVYVLKMIFMLAVVTHS